MWHLNKYGALTAAHQSLEEWKYVPTRFFLYLNNIRRAREHCCAEYQTCVLVPTTKSTARPRIWRLSSKSSTNVFYQVTVIFEKRLGFLDLIIYIGCANTNSCATGRETGCCQPVHNLIRYYSTCTAEGYLQEIVPALMGCLLSNQMTWSEPTAL